MKVFKSRKFVRAAVLAVLCVALAAAAACAHGVWFATRLSKTQLVLGEGPDDRPYDPKAVFLLQGYDKDYNKVEVKPIVGKTGEFITIEPAENVAVVTAGFSYGYWMADSEWKNWKRITDENKDAKDQIANLKYDVFYRSSVKAPKPIEGLPFQIVPMSDPTVLKVGDTLVVQVLKDGKPMPNAEIIPDFAYNAEQTIKADSDGKAAILIRNATFNVIGMEFDAEEFKDPANPNVTRGTFASCLSFLVK